jgi:hypothetical protein
MTISQIFKWILYLAAVYHAFIGIMTLVLIFTESIDVGGAICISSFFLFLGILCFVGAKSIKTVSLEDHKAIKSARDTMRDTMFRNILQERAIDELCKVNPTANPQDFTQRAIDAKVAELTSKMSSELKSRIYIKINREIRKKEMEQRVNKRAK